MNFKARVFEVEQGQNEVILNERQAKELDISLSDRLQVNAKGGKLIAIADLSGHLVKHGELGVFQEVADLLKVKDGQGISVALAQKPASLDAIRKKLDGGILSGPEIDGIINDLMDQKLSSAELAGFICAVYTRGMTVEETIALTKAIYYTGESLNFKNGAAVVSEHSIGGVAGDRVSMIIVPILASMNIMIPKTCSRAISSASGTADAMEVLAPVSLNAGRVHKIVMKTHGCVVWGGGVNIAAADDKLIKIRNPLRLDPKPLLLSSILAKKRAEGAQYVLLDIPTGRGAKVATVDEARELAREFTALGAHLDMKVECSITDGSEPLMEYIGPAFEARAVLETLGGKGSSMLAEKAAVMAGIIIAMVKGVSRDEGYKLAIHQLKSGRALQKFREIIGAQGGNANIQPEDIRIAPKKAVVLSRESGLIAHVDNRALSRIGRALGAPQEKEAGIILKVMKGHKISAGEPLMELYSNSKEKLDYAVQQAKQSPAFEIEKVIIDII